MDSQCVTVVSSNLLDDNECCIKYTCKLHENNTSTANVAINHEPTLVAVSSNNDQNLLILESPGLNKQPKNLTYHDPLLVIPLPVKYAYKTMKEYK